jgi:hypothetical protein
MAECCGGFAYGLARAPEKAAFRNPPRAGGEESGYVHNNRSFFVRLEFVKDEQQFTKYIKKSWFAHIVFLTAFKGFP